MPKFDEKMWISRESLQRNEKFQGVMIKSTGNPRGQLQKN